MNESDTHKCDRPDHRLFFKDQMATMSRSTEITKNMFCFNEYEKCAPYLVYRECGSEYVEIDLFPSEFNRAKEILKECKEQ